MSFKPGDRVRVSNAVVVRMLLDEGDRVAWGLNRNAMFVNSTGTVTELLGNVGVRVCVRWHNGLVYYYADDELELVDEHEVQTR